MNAATTAPNPISNNLWDSSGICHIPIAPATTATKDNVIPHPTVLNKTSLEPDWIAAISLCLADALSATSAS